MNCRSLPWRVWLGFGVSLLCFGLVFYGVQSNELIYSLKSVSVPYLFIGLALFACYLVVAAHRWRLILEPIRRLSLIDSLSPIMIGRLVDNLLPLRAGEIAKMLLMSRKLQRSESTVLATIVLDRLFDLSTLLLFVLVLILVIDLPAGVRQSAILISGIVTIGFAVSWFMSCERNRVEWVQIHLLTFLPQRFKQFMANLVVSFVYGLGALQQAKTLLLACFYSILGWIFACLSAWFFLEAVHLNMSWYVPVLLLVVTNFGSLVPTAPGSMGVFHALVVYSLSIWSIAREPALTMAIVYHESIYVLVTLLGLLFMWREGYSWRMLQSIQEPKLVQEIKTL